MLSSEPVRHAEDFIGREREIVQITEVLVAERSCCLVGPVGSGKTSLLLHIQQMIDLVLDVPPTPIYLDLRSVRQAGDFYEPILRQLEQKGSDELDLGQFLGSETAPMLLLLLDNLAEAGVGWSSLMRSALRGWINDGHILIVAASDQPLGQAAPDLQQTLLQITVPPLPEREARALITVWLEKIDQAPTKELITDILVTAGGYPERIRRAIELWQRSQTTDFDWQRAFRKNYPDQATLADEVGGWNTELEAGGPGEQHESATRPASSRRRKAKKEKPNPTYDLDDPSDFLAMIILVAIAVVAWVWVGSWVGGLVFLGVLIGWVAIAWLVVRIAGDKARTSFFVRTVRWLPLIGRFAPPIKA